MNCLITGATGDIGSLVVERLIKRGDRPRLFVRDAEKAKARYGDRVDVFVGDLADAATLVPHSRASTRFSSSTRVPTSRRETKQPRESHGPRA